MAGRAPDRGGEPIGQRTARLAVEIGAQPQHRLLRGRVSAHRPQPDRVTGHDQGPQHGPVAEIRDERGPGQAVPDRAERGGRGSRDIPPPRCRPRLLADVPLEHLHPGPQAADRSSGQFLRAQRVPGLPQLLQGGRGRRIGRGSRRRQEQGLGPGAF